MKYPMVILLLVFLSSATRAEQYRWDYMDIGLSNDGLGKGMIFAVASHTVGNFCPSQPDAQPAKNNDKIH